jgi:predicted nucleotidyltransferase
MDGGALEATLRTFFAEAAADIVAVYLYGSYARGSATDRSDVDLAILYVKDPPPSLEALPLDLESDLERAIGLPVQAVVLNRAPVDLIHRVFRDGKLVLDRDRSRRIRFEVKARNEFFDLQSVLERYRAPRAAGP